MSIEDQLRAMIVSVVRDELAKQKPATDGEHLTVAQYAARLAISERTVRDAIRDGRLAHERIGRAVRIPAEARIAKRADKETSRARLVLLGGKR